MSLQDPPINNAFPAHAGFSGAVMYSAAGSNYLIRAKDCSVNAKQEINAIDDIDGAIDKTRYTLSPYQIEGSLSFALDQSQTADSFAVFEQLFKDAVERDSHGNMLSKSTDRSLHVRYYPGASYTYLHVLIDQLSLEVSEGSELTASATVKGRGRTDVAQAVPNLDSGQDLAPVRAIMFNDISVTFSPSTISGANTIDSSFTSTVVQSFKLDIANNTDFVYTLASSLSPYDIIAKKRDITGSITFLGKNDQLAPFATMHEHSAQSAVDMTFSIKFSADAPPVDLFQLKGVVFQIEEISVSNDLITSTMNYRAYGEQGFGYEAISGFGEDGSGSPANSANYPFGNDP
tara:strand:- start:735 stop:1772 length:1038 start_codon:yes stop_codon:yes gene_type:complete